MARSDHPAVSVIVAFRNAERHLANLLESLAAQNISEPWEVIAVDNGSTDRSRDIASQYQRRFPLVLRAALEKPNVAYARNEAVQQSRGDKLLFIDADDTVNGCYASEMSRALETHELVTSRVDSVTLNPDWVLAAQGPAWQAEGVGVLYDFLPAAGSNIGVRRRLYESLGGFSEEMAGCEDIAFSWQAQLDANVEPYFVENAVYRYRYRDTLYGLYRQSKHWGSASARLYHRFRDVGMPARPLRTALTEWSRVLGALLRAPDRAARAPLVVRLGYCVGRLDGSLRTGVRFL